MKNTRITYLYRDGCNNKQHQEVVVTGSLTLDQISPHLDGGLWFIAGQVGLPEPQLEWEAEGYAYPSEDDHVWCELHEGDIEPTDDPPTVEVTADEVLARFREVEGKWDVEAAIARLGLDCKPLRPDATRIVRVRCQGFDDWAPCVEIPADATEEQLRRLAVRVAMRCGPHDLMVSLQVLGSPVPTAEPAEEGSRPDTRFWLGTRRRWHLAEDADDQDRPKDPVAPA